MKNKELFKTSDNHSSTRLENTNRRAAVDINAKKVTHNKCMAKYRTAEVQAKQNAYLRGYRLRKKITESESDQQVVTKKRTRYTKAHRKEIANKGDKIESVRTYKKTSKQSQIHKSLSGEDKCIGSSFNNTSKAKNVRLDKDNYLLHFDSKHG